MKAVSRLSPRQVPCYLPYKFRVVVTSPQVKNMETL